MSLVIGIFTAAMRHVVKIMFSFGCLIEDPNAGFEKRLLRQSSVLFRGECRFRGKL
ncbi:hypothetical protein AXX16_4530 [Serratia rubidaea]|nr:hypothetical protein AXX16_4530 [Serratia rubidaea]